MGQKSKFVVPNPTTLLAIEHANLERNELGLISPDYKPANIPPWIEVIHDGVVHGHGVPTAFSTLANSAQQTKRAYTQDKLPLYASNFLS